MTAPANGLQEALGVPLGRGFGLRAVRCEVLAEEALAVEQA